jgi:hypothetical protein
MRKNLKIVAVTMPSLVIKNNGNQNKGVSLFGWISQSSYDGRDYILLL